MVLAALGVILAIPFLLRPKDNLLIQADETIVLVSPHNEAIREEFSRTFGEYYKAKTGKTVRLDWRSIGGTSDITKFMSSQFDAAFGVYWRHDLGRTEPLDSPEAKKAFLESKVGIGIDLFFGGGSYDFNVKANSGQLVDCGLIQARPDLFGPNADPAKAIPQSLGGEPLWDPQGRWIGACLSGFGLCYNVDSYQRLKIEHPPQRWSDLADPRLLGEIALADPTKSGSITKAFEMLVQEQMQRHVAEKGNSDPATLSEGWNKGLQLLQKLGANTRYFTDSAGKVPIEVSMGDAAAGMCIDFYGRFQAESLNRPGLPNRMVYVSPEGGTSTGSDPIGLLRGAPNRDVAVEFIAFVMSLEGQKLWDFKVGAPGGPAKFALRRLPISPELYRPEYQPYMSDPGVNPYIDAQSFHYHGEWTAKLFDPLRLIVRVMCIDSYEELRDAWSALIEADFPPEATARFSDVSKVSYEAARTMGKGERKIDSVRLTRDLTEHFRQQYREAAALARAGR